MQMDLDVVNPNPVWIGLVFGDHLSIKVQREVLKSLFIRLTAVKMLSSGKS